MNFIDQDPVDKIMNFVRWDGPLDAKIRFLTIEDGGGFTENQKDNRDKFLTYFNSDWHWLPKDPSELNGSLGKPGNFIPKIMIGLAEGNLSRWEMYKHNQLYMKNESNIKFYPISRKDTSEWDERYTEYIGKTKKDYETLCWNHRPKIIAENKAYNFNSFYYYIILGAEKAWLNCLKLIFNVKGKEIDFDSTETFSDSKNLPKYRFYYDINQNLIFSYYPIFRFGNKDSDILDFCKELSKRNPNIKQYVN